MINDKRLWYSIQSLSELSAIASIYIVLSLITSFTIKETSLPFYCALTTGFMAGITISRGRNSIFGFLVGAIIWQLITPLFSQHSISFTSWDSILFVFSEGITLILLYYFFRGYINSISIIEQISGLAKLFIYSLLCSIPQALILSYITSNATEVFHNTNFLVLFHLTWLSISVSILSVVPFIISYFDRNKQFTIKSIRVSWELTLYVLLLLAINFLEIFNIITPPYPFPIHFIVFLTIFILAFRKDIRVLSFSVLLFYLISIYSASTNHGIFISNDPYLNASNIYYFILFFLFISLTVGVVVNEKNKAFVSLTNAYTGVEVEISRQTSIFRELNDKLFAEIEQRGIVERELNESRNLLEVAQDIAKITTWELNLEKKEIRWSNSAKKIFGFKSDRPFIKLDEYLKLIFPEDIDKFNSTIQKVSVAPIDFEVEIRHKKSDGTINDLLIRGRSFEENGKVTRVIGLSLDITEKKEVENRLIEKEEKYRSLFEANIDSVTIIDPISKTFVDVNNAFENRYGYTKAEIIGKPYSIITSEVEETYSAIDNAYRLGSHRVQTRIHKKKNGEEFYAEGIFVKFISLGKPLIFVISQDITKRKIAEKNLAERELQYRLFFESDLIGMAEVTQQKEWKTVNHKLCKILGYKEEELIGKTWDNITHPEDLIPENRLYIEVITHKTNGYSIEKRFTRKDGSSIYCNVALKAIKTQQGNISHFVKLIEDISTRKQIEKDLIESRATLRRAQQIAKLGSCSWSIGKNYITLNDEAYPILDWKKSQGPFNIEKFINLFAPESKALIDKTLKDATKGLKSVENIEAPIITSTGEVKYLLLNIGFNIGSSVAVSEVVTTLADITEIKKAEIALQEANSLKDQLFSIIGHDLRSPIGSINQMITYLAENLNTIDQSTLNEIISTLKDSSMETFNLLENLLEWAKSQRQVSFKPEKIHVKLTIDETMSLLSGMSSQKNITITNNLNSTETVFADPYMLKTILRNLISNAIKFTPNNGNIKIDGARNGSETVLRVTDSGMGIPKESIEKLFDSNSTYTTAGTNNEQGTGLGLKLIKRLITKNNGEITVESEINKGTTFIVTLPS